MGRATHTSVGGGLVEGKSEKAKERNDETCMFQPTLVIVISGGRDILWRRRRRMELFVYLLAYKLVGSPTQLSLPATYTHVRK